jgi:hypothetical protein
MGGRRVGSRWGRLFGAGVYGPPVTAGDRSARAAAGDALSAAGYRNRLGADAGAHKAGQPSPTTGSPPAVASESPAQMYSVDGRRHAAWILVGEPRGA